ncbi:protein kinase domain-containing protein [Streptomyces decoyicus]|uniref:protein kinase domain-containing protein n=1 Tax=Streptomyces decoyicus TaxID=249567 RepID=UPI00069F4E36|nr:PQQ-binding-like beta-propeller repeat protein [Streptomyces decoyicus]KOG38449.1 serine/threonine protein kinase [Streptomyces decoyicus]QZY17449.1 PQQ-binding-like beta-propeller repeat protein [Streptomyces decoyicus]
MPSLRNSGVGPEAEHPEYAGQYRLEARLGSGGMGVVHLARSSSGLQLAVKVIHAEFAQDPEFRGRFRQEVAAARRVSGAFTAPVVDADPDAERPWMATLHIPGPTLSDHVKRNGPLAVAEVRRLAAGLAEALRDIHRAGVVHRDLKPGNVLLAADGPKVIDFGISRPSDSEMRTETGKLIGTPPFMAPEQFQRPREVGPAADVFALGSVLVHAATGSGPFDSESPYIVAYQVVHDEADLAGVPAELVPLVEGCLAKDPADRPTPGALMELLRTDVPHGAASGAALPVSMLPDGMPPAGSSPDTAAGGAAAVRIPEQRQRQQRQPEQPAPEQLPPVRAEATPPRAETTHVRVPAPVESPAEGTAWSPAGSPADAGPAAAPKDPTGPADSPDSGFPAGPGRPARSRTRRWPLWAALALVVTGAGAFAGVRAPAPGGTGQDPALQTRPSHLERADFHPWRTTLVERPTGHDAEMPFCTAGSGAVFCGQSGVPAARLDPDTGRPSWRRTDHPSQGKNAAKYAASPTPPVLSGGALYVFSADGKKLSALDPSAGGKGATRWTKDLSGYEGETRIVGNRILLTAADGTVTALDSTTHRQRWHKRFPGHQLPLFSSFGGPRTAYAAEGTPDGTGTQVTAIDPADGKVRWSRRLPGALAPAGTGASGALYLTVTDAKFTYRTTAVLRYDPATGRTRRLPLTAPLDQVAAVVHGESVYLLAEGGALQAVGERKWDTETSVSRGSAPVVSGGTLYFTAADGRLLAVDTHSGGLLGQTPPRLDGRRHNGYLQMLPAPRVDASRGRIYAAAPDGTVFAAATKDPSAW